MQNGLSMRPAGRRRPLHRRGGGGLAGHALRPAGPLAVGVGSVWRATAMVHGMWPVALVVGAVATVGPALDRVPRGVGVLRSARPTWRARSRRPSLPSARRYGAVVQVGPRHVVLRGMAAPGLGLLAVGRVRGAAGGHAGRAAGPWPRVLDGGRRRSCWRGSVRGELLIVRARLLVRLFFYPWSVDPSSGPWSAVRRRAPGAERRAVLGVASHRAGRAGFRVACGKLLTGSLLLFRGRSSSNPMVLSEFPNGLGK